MGQDQLQLQNSGQAMHRASPNRSAYSPLPSAAPIARVGGTSADENSGTNLVLEPLEDTLTVNAMGNWTIHTP